jgi:hypothetical protein
MLSGKREINIRQAVLAREGAGAAGRDLVTKQ